MTGAQVQVFIFMYLYLDELKVVSHSGGTPFHVRVEVILKICLVIAPSDCLLDTVLIEFNSLHFSYQSDKGSFTAKP